MSHKIDKGVREANVASSYRVSQQVLDGNLFKEISKSRSYNLEFFVKKSRQIERM